MSFFFKVGFERYPYFKQLGLVWANCLIQQQLSSAYLAKSMGKGPIFLRSEAQSPPSTYSITIHRCFLVSKLHHIPTTNGFSANVKMSLSANTCCTFKTKWIWNSQALAGYAQHCYSVFARFSSALSCFAFLFCFILIIKKTTVFNLLRIRKLTSPIQTAVSLIMILILTQGGFFMHLWELERERLFNFLNFSWQYLK